MKNIFKFNIAILIFLFGFLNNIPVFANNCPSELRVSFTGGEIGCLNELPISKKLSKTWQKSIGDVIKNGVDYVIVGSDSCNIYEIFSVSSSSGMEVRYRLPVNVDNFIRQCPTNCNCSRLVNNGSVLMNKKMAVSLGAVNLAIMEPSTTAEKQPPVLDKSLSDWLAAQHAIANNALVSDAEISARDRLTADLEASRKRQSELEEQLRFSQILKQKEEEKILAEKNAKEVQKVIDDSRLKEQLLLELNTQQKELLRNAELAAKQKEQDQLIADQKAKEQLRLAVEEAKNKSLEIYKLKQELANSTLKSQDLKPTSLNRKALVIGNDSYSDVPKLANARQDANAVGRTLTELGYKVVIKNDLKEKDMKAALRQFKNDLEGGDEVLFFYAGHGVQLGATNYLLPIDIKGENEDQVRDDAIQLQRLLDDMNEKKVKLTLAIIDACRDNPFPKSGRAIGGRGLAPTTAATGQMIIFSAGSGQQALDKLGPADKSPNGLFTRMLLNEMKAPGVRVDNMIRNVRRKVVEAAKTIGHDQVPAIYDQVVGDFYLSN